MDVAFVFATDTREENARSLMQVRTLWLLSVCACAALSTSLPAQTSALPATRVIAYREFAVPGRVDSGVPMVWTRINGQQTLVAFASWGGIPMRMAGTDLEHLQPAGDVVITPHPGDGIWLESVIADQADVMWYAYYHHEAPARICGRPESIPQIGAAKSVNRGQTWTNLGIILEAPRGSEACESTNRFVLGGVGDVSAMVDHDWKDVYLYYSSYDRDPTLQGVALARLAWADRDDPRGRVTVWQDGVWLSPIRRPGSAANATVEFDYPAGTPMLRPTSPWHDGIQAANVFWGPSIHWNTSVNRYIMLLNRTRDEAFNNEGIYVSFAWRLDDPPGWSAPQKILKGGNWYPQVAAAEPGIGTDKQAGRFARLFLTGRSNHYIEFAGR
jgi:hypothetical protein